jgi:tetratricopeptide (TPR) repeat protein
MKLILFLGLLFIIQPNCAKAQDTATAEKEFAAGNYKKVQQILSPYIESLDRRPLILLAQSYSKLKNHLSATKVYRAALSKNSGDLEAKSLLAVELLNLNQELEAKQVLKEIIESNPTFVPAYTKLADIYEKSNNNYELRLLYQDLISKIGEKAKYITKLCALTTDEGLYDLSKNYCEKGIKLSPYEPINYLSLAQTHLQTDKKI